MSQTRRHLLAASIAATARTPRIARAEPGVTQKRILFGQAAAGQTFLTVLQAGGSLRQVGNLTRNAS